MKIYFIAGCGVGVGNLAILLKKQGHTILMSDKGAYPPMSDLLKEHGISIDLGFDPDKITSDLDMVIMGGAALIIDPENPQVARAKELGLKLISYPHGIGEFISKEENIEVVGNHAKTTTTALIAWCLKQSGIDVSYFSGGSLKGFEEPIHSGNDIWSVCEGDEHPSLRQEPGGKFMYHKAKHVLLTSADWDHKNIYPTLEEYLQVYRDLFEIIPAEGVVTACLDGANTLELLKSVKYNKINLYTIGEYKYNLGEVHFKKIDTGDGVVRSLSVLRNDYEELIDRIGYVYFVQEVDYRWKPTMTRFNVKRLEFTSGKVEHIGYFETPIIGQIGVENSLAAIATLHGLGHSIEGIKKGIASFQGVHRKLEILREREYVLINDHAHSPIKIETALRAVRTKFHDRKIFAIFHVNQSGLKERKTFEQLQNAFNLANFVLVAKVTPDLKSDTPIYGKDYKDIIRKGAEKAEYLLPSNVYYTPLINQMKSVIENNIAPNDVILIMSSGDASEFIEMAKNIRVQPTAQYL